MPGVRDAIFGDEHFRLEPTPDESVVPITDLKLRGVALTHTIPPNLLPAAIAEHSDHRRMAMSDGRMDIVRAVIRLSPS